MLQSELKLEKVGFTLGMKWSDATTMGYFVDVIRGYKLYESTGFAT